MKLKAVLTQNAPRELVLVLNNLRGHVATEVVGPILHRPNLGPAEFYVQQCDYCDPSGGELCEVRLTGVSRTRDRSELDFENARDALVGIYTRQIKRLLPKGRRMQLFVTVMVDPPPSLIESKAIWVKGEAD